jgi:acyl-CoA synthetase (NDP forming)/L-amino acid N-acyltransferase YncA
VSTTEGPVADLGGVDDVETLELRQPLPAPADVLLADGTIGRVRVATPDDTEALSALHAGMSPDNLRMRFFSPSRRAAEEYVQHLRRDSGPLALLVERQGRVVALATAEPIEPEVAEVAFVVDDTLHGVGLGSLLLEHLAAAGRALGMRRFVAEVLGENRAMIDVFLDAGFAVRRHAESGTVHVEMDTVASAEAVEAADERECRAETRSLQPLLYPRSVAVAGVRRDGSGVGAAVLRSIVAGGYRGELWAVHPQATEVDGVRATRRLADLPEPVDLVVVAVPARRVVATLGDAADAGVPAAVVISSGFEELGEEGARLQRAMVDLARSRSIRLVGPNCLGLMSNHPDISLDATFSGSVPPPGGLAVASQSGGVGIVLSDVARELGLGVGSFVSLGNKADVSSNDLLAAWRDDPRVTAAALYLESFGNAPKFARVARRFAERKPLLAVLGGRSGAGRRAGLSHTAAAATPAVGVDALFAQAGVISCHGAEDLAETALLLEEQPLPAGPRLGVLSNAGGMGVLAADVADEHGLVVPELSDRLRARLSHHVLGTAGTGNPVDAGAGCEPRAMAAIADELLRSGEIDALVVVLVATGVSDSVAAMRRIAKVRGAHPAIPVVLVPMGGLTPPTQGLRGITTLRSTDAAVRSLARAARYAAWQRLARQAPEPVDPARAERARTVADQLLTASVQAGSRGWLSVREVRELVADYDLAPVGELATDAVAAAGVATEIGYPVAVKAGARDVLHRTDRGLVRVGLGSPVEVAAAVREFEREVGRPHVPVLIQPVARGVEIALGLVRDPEFGPLVMVAAGGTATELWADRVFLLPPISRGDAARAVRSLRVWPLLDGFRGAPRADVASLEKLVVRLGRLAEDVPQVAELDLNPVLVGPRGAVLVDVKIRLSAGRPVDAGIPRRLRGR